VNNFFFPKPIGGFNPRIPLGYATGLNEFVRLLLAWCCVLGQPNPFIGTRARG